VNAPEKSVGTQGLAAWSPLLGALREALVQCCEGRTPSIPVFELAPPSLRRLAERFGLGESETGVIALCAAAEWDRSIAAICARWHGEPARCWPSYGLAVELLGGGEWAALAPSCSVRRWRLVDVAPGIGISDARLSADERILNFLCDRSFLDPRLGGLIRPLKATADEGGNIVPRIVACWGSAASLGQCPVADLSDLAADQARRVAVAASEALSLRAHVLDARELPAGSAEREALSRLWEREALLLNGSLLLECADDQPSDTAARAALFVDGLQGLLFVAGRMPPVSRPCLRAESCLVEDAGLGVWQAALGTPGDRMLPELEQLCAQFRLGPAEVRHVVTNLTVPPDAPVEQLAAALWEGCRLQTRGGLETLAQRINADVGWEDLVLPPEQKAVLRTIALHVRQRHRVYRDWGFADRGGRGLGVAALFAGASGTGKTLAAEVLARELHLDLYRIDLAALVSKYIGETQKNLRRVFDAAEASGAILLFDEADALFGARGEVRDSLDRHANMEVAYLLQRIETYRGLAILTTNLKQAIDSAFLRRIRFVVNFPFPDVDSRCEIWRRVFPARMPRDGIDVGRLARLNLSGGHIRNLAVNAAFLAADAGEPVGMRHLLSAAEAEYAKLEKALPRGEVGDWT
jgi:AAA+ superfamily predicted ATPase